MDDTLDLVTLSWCLGEIREALTQTEGHLERQMQTGPGDLSLVRLARASLHQAHGALLVVEVPGVAVLTEEAEALLDAVERGQMPLTADIVSRLSSAFRACTEYLDDLLQGRSHQPLHLFPYLKALLEARGADRIHPADLFFPDLSRRLPVLEREVGEASGEELAEARAAFEKGLLRFLREPDNPRGVEYMLSAVGTVERSRRAAAHRNFWRVALAFFDALRSGALKPDVYAKRLLARLNLQLRKTIDESAPVADRLFKDTLFALAGSQGGSPVVQEVRRVYGLDGMVPADYEFARFGRQDARALRMAREALAQVKSGWDKVVRGNSAEMSAVSQALDSFNDAVEQLPGPGMRSLAAALVEMRRVAMRHEEPVSDELGLEVATAILCAEQILEQGGRASDELDPKAGEMALRLREAFTPGHRAPADVPQWLQDLSRAAQERLTMAAFISESLGNLRSVEKELDAFFRDASHRAGLPGTLRLLQQVSGALRLLDFADAAEGADAVSARVAVFIANDAAPTQAQCESVASSLGALGFFVEGLQQPERYSGHFEFDPVSGEFRARLGESTRSRREAPAVPADPQLQAQAGDLPAQPLDADGQAGAIAGMSQSIESALSNHTLEAEGLLASLQQMPEDPALRGQLRRALERVRDDAVLLDDGDLKRQANDALGLLADGNGQQIEQLSAALAGMAAVPAAEVPPESAPLPADEAAVDTELLEIFLSEAHEVLEAIGTSLDASRAAPSDQQFLTTIRRGFHTLKGSSRMVGLAEFGNAGWAMEQVLNQWLSEDRAGDQGLFGLIGSASELMSDWVAQLEANPRTRIDPHLLITAADAFRTSGVVGLPVRADAAAVQASVEPAVEMMAEPVAEPVAEPAMAAPSQHESTQDVSPQVEALPIEALQVEPLPVAPLEVEPIEVEPLEVEPLEVESLEVESLQAQLPSPAGLEDSGFEVVEIFAPDEPATEAAPQPSPVESLFGGESMFAGESVFDELDTPAQQALSWADEPSADLLPPDLPATAPHAEPPVTAPASLLHTPPAGQPLAEQPLFDGEPLFEPSVRPSQPASPPPVPTLTPARPVLADAPDFAEFSADIDSVIAEFVAEDAARKRQVAQTGAMPPQAPAEALAPAEATLAEAMPETAALETALAAPRADDGNALASDTVQIGPMSVSRPLYMIFLGEADDLIEVLVRDCDDWIAHPARGASESALRAVHSLSGSASLVGLTGVHAIAEQLESVYQTQTNSAQLLGDTDLRMLAAAIERMRAMLHQFAGGAVPREEPEALAAVSQLAERLQCDALAALAQSPVPQVDAAADEAARADKHALVHELPAPVVADELDAELLPIFIEEAEDLLPAMGENLRRWAQTPADASLAQKLMRAAHTVKGSARMAGAMALGQRVHDMETRIESMSMLPNIPGELIEDLLAEQDQIVAMFESIKKPGAALAAPSVPVAAESPVAGEPMMPVAPAPMAAEPATQAQSQTQTQSPVPAVAGPAAPVAAPLARSLAGGTPAGPQLVRVRAELLDRLVNEAGEVSISRAKLDNELSGLRQSLGDLTENVNRLRTQLREMEIQAETTIQARFALTKEHERNFDPLEFDRYTRFQELTRMMAESVNDVATVQQNASRNLDEAAQDLLRQGQVLRELQQNLMRVRMVQFGSISDRMFRVVRQAAKETGKRVNLDLRGVGVEVDRGVLERMAGPIEHLLRNAVGHGIESAAVRQAAGKSETGEICVEVRQEGNEIGLTFSDDGGGLDLARIRARAVAMGLITEQAKLSDRELCDLIFAPGFSTADKVTELSGRGVGMDVVRAETASLGGRIETESTPGAGTRFIVRLPLTLAIAQVVMVGAGGTIYAIPSSGVEQVLQLKPQPLAAAYAQGHVEWQGAKVPLFYLGTLVEAPDSMPAAHHSSPIVIVRSGNQRIALHVDTVTRNQEVVVKNVGPQVAQVRGVSGATVMGNGDILLIINPVLLAQSAAGVGLDMLDGHAVPHSPAQLKLPATVMVVDDSLTVRKATQRLLTREGYQVALAKDGVDALRQLQDGVPDVMLVDIEMPRMDGFDLTRNVRADERYRHVPIVMITSRTADKHRDVAMALGVDAYMGKPYNEEELLATVADFIAKAAPVRTTG